MKYGEIEAEIQTEKKALLLAYVRRDYEYASCRAALDQMLKENGQTLKVVLLDEDSIEVCRRFGIVGAPTFLFYFRGEELGRILGKVDSGTLNDFFRRKLPDLGTREEEGSG